ncbi:equilibrative nucleobase transporter 1 isoform X3 [Tiliqua scincoides]
MEYRGAGMAKRLATLISGLVECMCFAGVIFGWASLVYVLKDLRYFRDLCISPVNQTTNVTDCSAQDEQFSLIFTIGSFMNNFMTFPTGYIFDRFGTTVARLLAISSYTTGTLLIAFSSAATALMLFPALSLLSVGGILLILTNMQVGNLFGKHRSTVITLYNGAFDSSSAVFLVIKLLYERGLSLSHMFLFLSACSAWHLFRTFFLMPRRHIPYPLPSGYTYGVSCQRRSSSYRTYEEKRRPENLGEDEMQDGDSALREGNDTTQVITGKGDPGTAPSFKEPTFGSFWSCVFSKLFFWHLVWLSVMQLRHYLFIGTFNPMLVQLANKDPDLVSSYTNAFAYTQLCGVLCAPWNGLILDRHKRGRKKDGTSQGMFFELWGVSFLHKHALCSPCLCSLSHRSVKLSCGLAFLCSVAGHHGAAVHSLLHMRLHPSATCPVCHLYPAGSEPLLPLWGQCCLLGNSLPPGTLWETLWSGDGTLSCGVSPAVPLLCTHQGSTQGGCLLCEYWPRSLNAAGFCQPINSVVGM